MNKWGFLISKVLLQEFPRNRVVHRTYAFFNFHKFPKIVFLAAGHTFPAFLSEMTQPWPKLSATSFPTRQFVPQAVLPAGSRRHRPPPTPPLPTGHSRSRGCPPPSPANSPQSQRPHCSNLCPAAHWPASWWPAPRPLWPLGHWPLACYQRGRPLGIQFITCPEFSSSSL